MRAAALSLPSNCSLQCPDRPAGPAPASLNPRRDVPSRPTDAPPQPARPQPRGLPRARRDRRQRRARDLRGPRVHRQRRRDGAGHLRAQAGRPGRHVRRLRLRRHAARLHPGQRAAHAGPVGRIPDTMRQATVAIEDRRFYKHGGVDFEGVIRAAIKNIASGKTVEGGSTLTMQLVRNLYTENRARSGVAGYKRKVREAKLASELEDRHPGRGARTGSSTSTSTTPPTAPSAASRPSASRPASRIYFDKPARRLKLAEAALLAGLPQAPSRYNPFLDPGGGDHPPQRGPAPDGQGGLHHAGHGRRGAAREARSRRAATTPSAARATSSTTSSSS